MLCVNTFTFSSGPSLCVSVGRYPVLSSLLLLKKKLAFNENVYVMTICLNSLPGSASNSKQPIIFTNTVWLYPNISCDLQMKDRAIMPGPWQSPSRSWWGYLRVTAMATPAKAPKRAVSAAL